MIFKLGELKSKAAEIFVKSPIEIIISSLFLLLGVWVTWSSQNNFGSAFFTLKFYFFACVGLSYAMNRIFTTSNRRWLYYGSLLTPFLAYLYIEYGNSSDLSLIVTTICVVLLMFIGKGLKNNTQFAYSSMARCVNLILSGALSGVAAAALVAVYFSFVYIFDMGSGDDSVLLTILDIAIYAFFPFLFLLFEYSNATPMYRVNDEDYDIAQNNFIKILLNYILTPAIVLFGIILYIYFARITLLWELPKGVISATAITFLAGGIIVNGCRKTLDKPVWSWFFDYFRFIALPALGMLWVAVVYRVAEYGFTDKRVYLTVGVVVLTVWILAQFFKRLNIYHHLTIFTVSIFFIFTYIPFINANAVQKRVVVSVNLIDKDSIITVMGDDSDVDISGYSTIRDVDERVIEDTLRVSSADGETLYLEISLVDLFDNIMFNSGIENYGDLSFKEFRVLSKSFVYRDDKIVLIFDNIDFKVCDEKYSPAFVAIRSAITR